MSEVDTSTEVELLLADAAKLADAIYKIAEKVFYPHGFDRDNDQTHTASLPPAPPSPNGRPRNEQ